MSAEEAAAEPVTAEEKAGDAGVEEVKADEEEAGGLDEVEEDDLILIPQDTDTKIPVPRSYLKLSNFVETILAGDGEAKEIQVKQVTEVTLNLVVEYLNMHKGEVPPDLPCPVRSTDMTKICPVAEDATFIDRFDKKTIFEIILAANYMDIKPLLHLGCAKIATLIKQLDQKEINRIIEEEEKWQKEHGAAAGIVAADELKVGDEAAAADAGGDAAAEPVAAAES